MADSIEEINNKFGHPDDGYSDGPWASGWEKRAGEGAEKERIAYLEEITALLLKKEKERSGEGQLVHRGLQAHRLENNPCEAVFQRKWEELNNNALGVSASTLTHILKKMDDANALPDQRDASVAASVIQWLGSPVGLGFIESALNESGYVMKKAKTE